MTNRMDIRYLRGYRFVSQDKPYHKEACDVRTQYSIIFSLSSNQNHQPVGITRCQRISYSSSAGQSISARLSWLRSKSLRCPQLDRTHSTGSEHSLSTRLDQMPVPQTVLPAMSGHPYRGFGAFSSLFAGNTPDGPLCISIMSDADRL